MIHAMPRRWARWIAASTALAWLGFYLHNIADLPGQSLLSPETALPTLVTLALFLAWWRFPARPEPMWLLFGWAMLNLVGGGLSVLPFPFLPFYPEQSVRHYLFHGLYAAAQLPLIVFAGIWLRRSRS